VFFLPCSTVNWLFTDLTQGTRFDWIVATPFKPPDLIVPLKVTAPSLVSTMIGTSFNEAVLASRSFTFDVMVASSILEQSTAAGFAFLGFFGLFEPPSCAAPPVAMTSKASSIIVTLFISYLLLGWDQEMDCGVGSFPPLSPCTNRRLKK
jgi:hypothetical protein